MTMMLANYGLIQLFILFDPAYHSISKNIICFAANDYEHKVRYSYN